MKNKLKLSPKAALGINVRRTLVYVVTGLGTFALLFIGAFFYFNWGNSEEARAENGTYSSARNGSWYTTSTWADWANPSYNNFPDWNSAFNINHHVTFGDLKLKNGNKLIISGTLEVDNIEALTQLNIEVTSTGTLIVNGDLTNKSGGFKFVNNGEVIITGSLNTYGQGITIENNNNFSILNTLNVENGLTVTTKENFKVGIIKAGNNFTITNKGNFDTSTSIEAGNSFKIDNDGKFSSSEINAKENFTLNTKGNFEVEGITAGNQLKINSEGNFVSSGEINAKENFTLTTKDNFVVEGITAGNQFKLTSEGEFISSGEINAKENFTLTTKGDFTVEGISAGNQLKINSEGEFASSGEINAKENFTLTTKDNFVVEGITAGNQFKLTSNGEFISKGNIEAGNNFAINSEGVLIVIGDIEGAHQFKINSNGEMVVTGDIDSGANFGSEKDFLYLYGEITTGSNPNYRPILDDDYLMNNNIGLYNQVQQLINENMGILPIVLDHFNAAATASNTILVQWSTFSEKNNDFFTLERSMDGKSFETITTIAGAGNSNKKLYYSFEDSNPLPGYNYYRLKQTDFNGDFEYFNIVGVHNKTKAVDKIASKAAIEVGAVWPNPFRDHVNINFEAAEEGNIEVIVQNAVGAIVHKRTFPFSYGEHTYTFENTGQLESGTYYISLWQNGKKHQTQKLIKL